MFASNNMRPWLMLSLALCLAGACTRGQTKPAGSAGWQIDLALRPNPATIGASELEVTVLDAQGSPLSGAVVLARGDMTHAGMVPVFGDSEEVSAGVYTIPFEWTMAGSWQVTIEVEDGRGESDQAVFNVLVGAN